MADENAKDVLGTAATWLGSGGALVGVGVFLRGFFNGTAGQEKEVREDLRIEVKRLSDSLSETRDEVDALRLQIRHLSEFNLHVIVSRAEARAELAASQRRHGEPLTVWPPDPVPPTGGTP